MNYVGHLAFGLNAYNYIKEYVDDKDVFLTACVAPDIAIPENLKKSVAHFRHKSEKLYSAPDLDVFINKYKDRMTEDFMLGFFCHLYADNVFTSIYMPYVAKPLDSKFNFHNKKDAKFVKLKKQEGKIISVSQLFAENQIYRDYNKSITRLIKDFSIPHTFNFSTKDPHICEIDGSKLTSVKSEVEKFLNYESKKEDTFLLDLDEYIKFIKTYSKEFSKTYEEILDNIENN